MTRSTRCRVGFTLIEVLVALALTAVVVTLAHALLAAVTDAVARGATLANVRTRDANQRRWLTAAFANIVIDPRSGWGFEGIDGVLDGMEADRVTFTTRVRRDTTFVTRRITLALSPSGALVAETTDPGSPAVTSPDSLRLREDLLGFGAEYLPAYGARTSWVRNWISPASAPLAVRLRLGHAGGVTDTLILAIGERG